MAQTQEEKDAAKAAKEAEAKRLSDEADKTAAAEAKRIEKEDAAKAKAAEKAAAEAAKEDPAAAERAARAEEALQREEAAEKAAAEASPEINVLPMHDIIEKNDDVYIYENVRLPKQYAGEKGVKKFEGDNGQVIYYTQVLVKKFSDNVVTDGATEELPEDEE